MGMKQFQLRVLGTSMLCSWGWDSIGDAISFAPGLSPALAISGTPPALAPAGAGYSFTPSATGGTPPYEYSLTGALPPGLSFNPATGAITGTPL